MSARIAARRITAAARHRPDAIQVILPDWVPLTTRDAVAALEAMAGIAGDLPLVLYNPPHAKTVLAPADLGVLAAAVPTLVAVKVGAGGPQWYAEMRKHLDRLAVFVPGHTLATATAEGAAGSFSNVACLSPAGAVVWEAQIRADPAAAIDVQRRLNRFLDEHILPWARAGYANPALDKALAVIGNWCDVDTRIRGPWRSLPTPDVVRLRPIARAAVPELFSP